MFKRKSKGQHPTNEEYRDNFADLFLVACVDGHVATGPFRLAQAEEAAELMTEAAKATQGCVFRVVPFFPAAALPGAKPERDTPTGQYL